MPPFLLLDPRLKISAQSADCLFRQFGVYVVSQLAVSLFRQDIENFVPRQRDFQFTALPGLLQGLREMVVDPPVFTRPGVCCPPALSALLAPYEPPLARGFFFAAKSGTAWTGARRRR
jgi:hypothetical protein